MLVQAVTTRSAIKARLGQVVGGPLKLTAIPTLVVYKDMEAALEDHSDSAVALIVDISSVYSPADHERTLTFLHAWRVLHPGSYIIGIMPPGARHPLHAPCERMGLCELHSETSIWHDAMWVAIAHRHRFANVATEVCVELGYLLTGAHTCLPAFAVTLQVFRHAHAELSVAELAKRVFPTAVSVHAAHHRLCVELRRARTVSAGTLMASFRLLLISKALRVGFGYREIASYFYPRGTARESRERLVEFVNRTAQLSMLDLQEIPYENFCAWLAAILAQHFDKRAPTVAALLTHLPGRSSRRPGM